MRVSRFFSENVYSMMNIVYPNSSEKKFEQSRGGEGRLYYFTEFVRQFDVR